MPKTTNWDSVEVWERLVASIIASGVKLDLKTIATYYGTTYHSLENRFRKIKKDAEVLKAGVQSGNGDGAAASPSPAKAAPKTPHKPKTPKKDKLETVANGRVTKKTPSKKTPIKQEPVEEDGLFDDVAGNNGKSSDQDAACVDDDMFT